MFDGFGEKVARRIHGEVHDRAIYLNPLHSDASRPSVPIDRDQRKGVDVKRDQPTVRRANAASSPGVSDLSIVFLPFCSSPERFKC